MESRLPQKFLGAGGAAVVYYECIKSFSNAQYRAKSSAQLGAAFMRCLPSALANMPAVKDRGQQEKSIKGAIFEFLVAEMLMMHSIVPFYSQVEIRHVPQSKIDFLLYDERAPVILTCKMSLAERWRQAAYEGMCLKQVYRNAQCYIICAKESDVQNRNRDIAAGEIHGVDHCYMADSEDLQDLLANDISRRSFSLARPVNPIQGNPKIIGANL